MYQFHNQCQYNQQVLILQQKIQINQHKRTFFLSRRIHLVTCFNISSNFQQNQLEALPNPSTDYSLDISLNTERNGYCSSLEDFVEYFSNDAS